MVLEIGKFDGLPSDAVPVSGFTASDITTTTAVPVIAAPGAGKALYISKVIVQNKTVAEEALITIQDDGSTEKEIATVLVSTAAGNGGHAVFDFVPPIKLQTNQALDGIAASALGDTLVHASGWSGSA